MDLAGFLLKAGQGDQTPRVGAEEFDQILGVIRYAGWGFLLNQFARILAKTG